MGVIELGLGWAGLSARLTHATCYTRATLGVEQQPLKGAPYTLWTRRGAIELRGRRQRDGATSRGRGTEAGANVTQGSIARPGGAWGEVGR